MDTLSYLIATANVWLPIALVIGAVLGVSVFLFRLLGELFAALEARGRSRQRDAVAKSVLDRLNGSEAAPRFALYLRPFQSTGYQFLAGSVGVLASAGVALSAAAAVGQHMEVGTKAALVGYRAGDGDEVNWFARIVAIVLAATVFAFIVDWVLWQTYLVIRRQFLVARARRLAGNPLAEQGEIVSDFENIVAEGIYRSTRLNLIGLGNPNEKLGGSGRVRVPEAGWTEVVRRLMKEAKLIVLIVSPRPGTLWEIKEVLGEGFWQKTLFIQPPIGGVARAAYSPQTDYAAVQQTFADFGAAMPGRNGRGVAFAYSDLRSPPAKKIGLRSLGALQGAASIVGGDQTLATLFEGKSVLDTAFFDAPGRPG